MTEKLIVIGSGPAALTAALYVARANLEPLVLSGEQWGGQLMLTTDVENYPGFPEGVQGPELMDKMRRQAERFGSRMVDRNVTAVDFTVNPFRVFIGEEAFMAEAVIIATGASAKWLGLDSELRLRGRGVSSCAVCDGPFFRGKEVAVVGGGDTAMEEALFLAKLTDRVTVIHRRDKLRASKAMQERAFKDPKIGFRLKSTVTEVLGVEKVEGAIIKDVLNGETSRLDCQGLFVAIGHEPNTAIFRGQVEMDEKGYIVTRNGTSTSVEGVFAAGDVQDYHYRQVATAVGTGCMAAMDAERYLEMKVHL